MSTQLYEFRCSECYAIVLAEYDIAGDRHSDEAEMKARDCTGNGTMEYLKPHVADSVIESVDEKCGHGIAKFLRCERCVAEGVYTYAEEHESAQTDPDLGILADEFSAEMQKQPEDRAPETFGNLLNAALEYGAAQELTVEGQLAAANILSQGSTQEQTDEWYKNTETLLGVHVITEDDFGEVSPHTDGQPVAVAEPQGSVNVAPESENSLEVNLASEISTLLSDYESSCCGASLEASESSPTGIICSECKEPHISLGPNGGLLHPEEITTPAPNDFAEPPTTDEMFGSAEPEPTLNDILPDFDSLAAGENVAKETVVLELHVRRPSFRRAFRSEDILGLQKQTVADQTFAYDEELNKKVDSDYIHVSKDIIDRNEIKNINKRIGVLKSYMHTRCVPSSILAAGLYLLPIKFIQEMDTAISSAQADVDTLLNEFGPRYPAMIEAAKLKLGPHFNSNDYPPFNVLRAQWRIDAQYRSLNVPAVLQKVSSELFKREAAKCKAQWADTAQEVRDALRVGFTRLVSEFSDKLGNDPETGKPRVFQKGRLEKLRDFLITFEVRDLTGDAELASLASQARQLMEGADPAQLRKDGALRSTLEGGFKKIAEEAGKMVVVRERVLADEDEL